MTSPQVKNDGMCVLSDHKPVVAKKQLKHGKKKTPKPTWSCTARCRQVSDSEFETIVNLHDMFSEDVQVLRDRLGACLYVQTHIQEWEVPFNPEMPDYEHRVKERMGHPLACHLFGSECANPLRILRNALVHYPALSKLQNQINVGTRNGCVGTRNGVHVQLFKVFCRLGP